MAHRCGKAWRLLRMISSWVLLEILPALCSGRACISLKAALKLMNMPKMTRGNLGFVQWKSLMDFCFDPKASLCFSFQVNLELPPPGIIAMFMRSYFAVFAWARHIKPQTRSQTLCKVFWTEIVTAPWQIWQQAETPFASLSSTTLTRFIQSMWSCTNVCIRMQNPNHYQKSCHFYWSYHYIGRMFVRIHTIQDFENIASWSPRSMT